MRELDGDSEILRYRSRREIAPGDTRAWLQQAEADAAHPDTPTDPRRQYAFAAVTRTPASQPIILVQVGLTRTLTASSELRLDEAYLWFTTHRSHWGQGYATEAARSVLGLGFGQAGLRHIFAECHPDNLASRRVMDKLGLRPEAHPVEDDARFPERKDFYRAALSAGEWS